MNVAARYLTYKNEGNKGLLSLLPASPGRVLDCGCGAGDNARILKESGWRVTGVTIDPREQEAAKEFCDTVHLADLEHGLSQSVEGVFDVVLASHVLEHLAKPERLLQDLQRRMTANGVLAVALPNIAHYGQRLSLLHGRFDYTATGLLDRTHLRFYTHSTAIQLLERNGYELLRTTAEGALPWWKARRVVPINLASRLDKWAVKKWPNLFSYQSLLIARPQKLR
jgi:2-polyprenyl-3-methyl-5-hydroxy-6-metoxy-1,4-benzoquinol methylase